LSSPELELKCLSARPLSSPEGDASLRHGIDGKNRLTWKTRRTV
jgi:hypothetical protein